MRNLAFVIWMLGWAWLLCAYPSAKPDAGFGAFWIIAWLFVGVLTYEDGKERKQ